MARKPRKSPPGPEKHHPWIVRFVHFHIRLFVAIVLGVAAYFLLPGSWPFDHPHAGQLGRRPRDLSRCRHRHDAARRRPAPQQRAATQEDEGAIAILLLAAVAATASLGAIFAELAQVKSGDPGYGYHVALALGTVLLSWAFTHTIFALHYAYDFYGEGQRAKGLKFPDDDKPDYWDFIYFSFVIGMTFQVSDVQVTNKKIRRLVAAHGVISFLFNTTVIALTVNMATDAF